MLNGTNQKVLSKDNHLKVQNFPAEWTETILKKVEAVLTQFLRTEDPLKLMKTYLHFTLKSLFIFKMFKFLPKLFDHIEKWVY